MRFDRRPATARRRISLLAVAGITITALGAAAGCGRSDREQALDQATEQVRQRAALTEESISGTLASPRAPSDQALLDAVAGVAEGGERHAIVFERQVESVDRIRLDLAFDARSETGGMARATVVVRLCVRLTGTRGPDPGVTMTDIACGRIPENPLGKPDEIVGLAG
ncbi:hypothetical protein ACIBF5_09280 [Micromonospora sp. NPDC050417]|uniref:hypothetical protein n=1 Tax=Micromonospora sp. NPDC050417 TaxID=3364280 RepID=UPI00379762D4